MINISHRANLSGPNPDSENHPDAIDYALKLELDVEIDVRYYNNSWWLGHDRAQYKIELEYLCDSKLWCHAKDLSTLSKLVDSNLPIHFFFHQNDHATLTSKNYIWTYPGCKTYSKKSIVVLQDKDEGVTNQILSTNVFGGICSDYILNFYQSNLIHKK